MLKRKAVKSKSRKKNPDSDPSKVIDFNEEQLEEFYNSKTKVYVEHKYGFFYGLLIYSPFLPETNISGTSFNNSNFTQFGYSIRTNDDSVQFIFSPDNVKKIIEKRNTPPIIVLK